MSTGLIAADPLDVKAGQSAQTRDADARLILRGKRFSVRQLMRMSKVS